MSAFGDCIWRVGTRVSDLIRLHRLHRLVLELGITKQEAVDGFRYLPPNVQLTNSKGEFLPAVVGMRALPDGTFVENVRVGFHHLLLALSLIALSYQSLDYDIKQAKWKKLKDSAEDYAARMFQTFARCKFAKRHLLKQVQHFTPPENVVQELDVPDDDNAVGQSEKRDANVVRYRAIKPCIIRVQKSNRSAKAGNLDIGEIVVVLGVDKENTNNVRIHSGWVSLTDATGEELLEDVTREYQNNLQSMPADAPHKPDVPLRAWERFHKQWGQADTHDDRHARLFTMKLVAIRNALVHSMKTVFAIRMETNAQM